MYIEVKYGERTFGNDENCEQFGAWIRTSGRPTEEGRVSVNFFFAEEKDGKSVNPLTRGKVSGARLVLRREDARRLATAILWSLEEEADKSLSLEFPRECAGDG